MPTTKGNLLYRRSFSAQSPLALNGLWRSLVPVFVVLAVAGCTDLVTNTPDQPRANSSVVGTATDSLAPLYEMDNPDRLPNRYIVRFKPVVSDARAFATAIVATNGGRVYESLQGLKGFWGELPSEAIERLRRHPDVAYIEADVALRVTGVGDTTQFSAPWPLDRIDQRTLPVNGEYLYSANGQGVRIWIMDTGVDRYAPELAGRIDESWSTTNNLKDPYAPCNNHGTLMAIAAAGSVSGIAKHATIHSARIDSDCVTGVSSGAASAAFEFIADYSPRPAIINYSHTRNCWWIFCGQTVDDAARYAWSKGVTVVVSAGNGDGVVGEDACGFSPAHVTELITVGASDTNDVRHGYSNWGSCLDLFAPVLGGAGTSTAAAMVTGVAALELQLRPTASPNHVKATVRNKTTVGVLTGIGPGSPNRLLYSRQPTLTATIDGPGTIGPSAQCTWYGIYSGGQPPYSLEWRRDWAVVGSGPSYTVVAGGFADFQLHFQVTDGVGRTVTAWKNITIDPDNYQFTCTQ